MTFSLGFDMNHMPLILNRRILKTRLMHVIVLSNAFTSEFIFRYKNITCHTLGTRFGPSTFLETDSFTCDIFCSALDGVVNLWQLQAKGYGS